MAVSADSDAVIANPLRASGLIDAAGLEKARAFQKENGGLLSEALLRLDLIKENDFLRTFAELYSTRFVKAEKLKTLKPDDAVLELANVRACERLRMSPIRWDAERGEVHVVAAIPLSADLEPELRRMVGARVVSVYVATAGAVNALIRRWHYREEDAFAEVTANGAGAVAPVPRPEQSEDDEHPYPASSQLRDHSSSKTVMVHLDSLPADVRAVVTTTKVNSVAPAKIPTSTVIVPPTAVAPSAAPPLVKTYSAVPDHDLTIATLRRENARYRIAQEFHRRVSQERSLEAMIDRILNVVFELLPAEGAAIFLTSGKLETRARREGQTVNVPRAIIDQALLSSGGMLAHNVLVDERFDRSKSVMMRGVQSVMAVPLRARNRTLGVLYVDSVSQTAAFHEEDLPLLDSVGAQAAILLDNAELIAKVQQEVEHRTNLSRFLSAAAVDEVLNGRMAVKLDGASAEVTVLFADMRGFTRASAELRPEEVVQFLNRFFEEMVEAVEQYGGTIDKFIGDCVMALWGAPEAKHDDARNAVQAALSMVHRAHKIDVMGKPLEMGIGINTGEVVLGCIGSKRRVDYTAIGSTVNLAARLCGVAKEGEVLVTAETLMKAGPGVFADANEPVNLKGLEVPIVPYTLKSVGAPPRAPIQLHQLATASGMKTPVTPTPAVTRHKGK